MARDQSNRPLIDYVRDTDLDVSDEDDAFYAHEGDQLLSAKWRVLLGQSVKRVPRRVQRYFVVYVVAAVVLLVSWFTFLGPGFAVYREELSDMKAASRLLGSLSVAPQFQDMVQVRDLDEKHLPRGDKRLVVIGDVHGCLEELKALLDKVGFEEKQDHLILTGDIVAKGPDSPGVVAFADRIHASCVRGNHEDKVLLALTEDAEFHEPSIPIPDVSAAEFAPDFTESSQSNNSPKLLELAESFNEAQIAYLKSCPVILRVGRIGSLDNVAVVHAGLVGGVPFDKQDPFQVMNMRTINLKTLLPSETRAHTPWEKYWNYHQKKAPKEERTTVIYGHDRKRGKNIKKHSMGLDSGCVGGGHLTAMVIHEDGRHNYVQVKCKGYVN